MDLIDESKFNFLWVTEWPLFEYDEEAGRYYAAHHPFTMPADVEELVTSPETVKAQAYDLVLNGYELGGGSLRIYQRDVQEKMFEALGFTQEASKNNLDSYLMHLNMEHLHMVELHLDLTELSCCYLVQQTYAIQLHSLKQQVQADLLTAAPDHVDDTQLAELGIHVMARKVNNQKFIFRKM